MWRQELKSREEGEKKKDEKDFSNQISSFWFHSERDLCPKGGRQRWGGGKREGEKEGSFWESQ